MPTEYCAVCGCVIPFCKHTEVKAAGPWLRVCYTQAGTALIDNLHLGSLEDAIEHCKATVKLNPEYPRVVLHEGVTSDTPIVWDSKPARKKPEYKMLTPQIFPATSFRNIPEHEGKFVAMGYMLTSDGDLHDNKTRTSLLVKIDIEAGYIETLNSIYWIV